MYWHFQSNQICCCRVIEIKLGFTISNFKMDFFSSFKILNILLRLHYAVSSSEIEFNTGKNFRRDFSLYEDPCQMFLLKIRRSFDPLQYY